MLNNIHKSVRNAVFVKSEPKIIPCEVDKLAWVREEALSFAIMSRLILDQVRSIVEQPPIAFFACADTDSMKAFVHSASKLNGGEALVDAATAFQSAAKYLDEQRARVNSRGELTRMAKHLEECVDSANSILMACAARDKTWFKMQSEQKALALQQSKIEAFHIKCSADSSQDDEPSDIRSVSHGDEVSVDSGLRPDTVSKMSPFLRTSKSLKKLSFPQKSKQIMSSQNLDKVASDIEHTETSKVSSSAWLLKMPKVTGMKGTRETKLTAKQISEVNNRVSKHREKIRGLEFMFLEQGNELEQEFERLLGNRTSLIEEALAELYHHFEQSESKTTCGFNHFKPHIPKLLNSAKERRHNQGFPVRKFSWDQSASLVKPSKTPETCRDDETVIGPEMYSLVTMRTEPKSGRFQCDLHSQKNTHDASDSLCQFDGSDSSSSDLPPPTARTRLNGKLVNGKGQKSQRTPPPAKYAWGMDEAAHNFEGERTHNSGTEILRINSDTTAQSSNSMIPSGVPASPV